MRFAVVMDPLGAIRMETDTSYAMIEEAWRRGWETLHLEPKDMFVRDGVALAFARRIRKASPFDLDPPALVRLGEIDVIAMRKDPPFDMEYVFSTYILETARDQGALVFNDPRGLRDANEKFAATRFSRHMPPTLVSKDVGVILDFLNEHPHAILKPLDWMGGASIFHLRKDDPKHEALLDSIVAKPGRTVMVQKYLPEIDTAGDKRIFMIDGEPIEETFARFPKSPGLPANAARGGSARASTLTPKDREICADLAPYLKAHGLIFVGFDVIGDYLTEINVTSSTGIRFIQKLFGTNPLERLFDGLERHRSLHGR